mgnify:CR=1 FL=1
MLPRTKTHTNARALQLLLGLAITAVLLASGCDIAVVYGSAYEPEELSRPDLLAVTAPNGGAYEAGDSMEIVWTGSQQPEDLQIDLYLSGSLHTTIVDRVSNDGSYAWAIPADFQVATETPDEYQVVVSGYHPDQATGTLHLIAASTEFTILAAATGGLSDVTVSRRQLELTVTDNGREIDGDTVDLYLNGNLIVAGHILVAEPGTTFPVTLQAGENTLEVYAVNEGSVTPNTALLEISHVTAGLDSQEWRLGAGESGSLTITAP